MIGFNKIIQDIGLPDIEKLKVFSGSTPPKYVGKCIIETEARLNVNWADGVAATQEI